MLQGCLTTCSRNSRGRTLYAEAIEAIEAERRERGAFGERSTCGLPRRDLNDHFHIKNSSVVANEL